MAQNEGSLMQLAYRPRVGRIAGGVVLGLADRFQVNVWLLRLAFLFLILTFGPGMLLYVFLWFSMPGENAIISRLELESDGTMGQTERFETFAKLAMADLGVRSPRKQSPAKLLTGAVLLASAILLQILSNSGGVFTTAPKVVSASVFVRLSIFVDRFGSPIFFTLVGLLVLLPNKASRTRLIFRQSRHERLELDHSESKALYGLASGYAALWGIETSIIRVLLLILNFLTFGLVGVVYLISSLIVKNRKLDSNDRESDSAILDTPTREPLATRSIGSSVIGICLVLVAAVELATEYRLVFFNEYFYSGILFLAIGFLLSFDGLRAASVSSRAKLALLFGTGVFFYGVYSITMALFQVQILYITMFEVFFIASALTMAYFALVAFAPGQARNQMLLLGGFLLAVAVITQLKPDALNYLIALSRFYKVFYPVVLAASGLWLLLEQSAGQSLRLKPERVARESTPPAEA